MRKERKIRPGFTPQEDVQRFRGSRQQAMDSHALPKGQIIGWVASNPPPKASPATAAATAALSKSAKKNAKRKEKRQQEKDEKIRENWDSSEDEGSPAAPTAQGKPTTDAPNWAEAPPTKDSLAAKTAASSKDESADAVADKLDKLTV